MILFFALPLIFAIGVTPLLASNHNPAANAGRLRVAVADFDGGAIGLALTSHLARVAGAPGMPGLDVVAAAGTSPEALRREVRDGAAWGALWVRAGASAALDAAMADPAAPYDNGALVFAWDEGRNSMLTPARVAGPVKGALAAFTAAFTTAHLAATAANVSDIARVNPRLLLAPLATAEEVLFPAAQWPVMGVGLTIGNILVAVFSLSITLAVMKGLTPLFLSWRLPPLRLLAVRVLAITAYCGVVSATMATMALGLAGLTSHGDMWARVWVTFWVLQMVFTFYLGAAAALAGPDAVPVFFLFMLLSNIIGGWNTDLADFGCEGRSCRGLPARSTAPPTSARARTRTRHSACSLRPLAHPRATRYCRHCLFVHGHVSRHLAAAQRALRLQLDARRLERRRAAHVAGRGRGALCRGHAVARAPDGGGCRQGHRGGARRGRCAAHHRPKGRPRGSRGRRRGRLRECGGGARAARRRGGGRRGRVKRARAS